MNAIFILNCLFYGIRHNFSYIKYETKTLLIHHTKQKQYRSVLGDNMEWIPIKKTKKRIFKPFSDVIQHHNKTSDGADHRNNNVDLSIVNQNINAKLQENKIKYDLLKKLQSNVVSKIYKLQLINTYPEIFEKTSDYKSSLLRGLKNSEFSEFFIHDI